MTNVNREASVPDEWERTFDAVPDLIFILNLEHGIVRANRAAAAALGLAPEELVGRKCFECVHGLSEPPWFCPHSQLLEDGQEHSVELQELGRDFLVTVSPLRDRQGHLAGSVHVARDITARKQAELDLARQNAVLEGINRIFQEALTSETEAELGRAALAVAEELTGSKFGFIAELNQAGSLDCLAVSDPDREAGGVRASAKPAAPGPVEVRGLLLRYLWNEGSVVVNSPASHPDWFAFPEGQPPLTAFLGAPLKHGDRIFGLMALANKEAGYNEADQDAAEALSGAVTAALMRRRAERALEQAREELEQRVQDRTAALTSTLEQLSTEMEERLRAQEAQAQLIEILEATTDLVATADLDGRVLYINRAGRTMLGIGEDEDISQLGIPQCLPAWEADRAFSQVLPAAARYGAWHGETIFLHRNGHEIPTSQVVLAHRILAGETKFFSTIARDITAAKQALEALEAERQRLFALLEGLPAYVSLQEPNYRYVFVNRFFRERFGEPDGKTCFQILKGRDEPCEGCPIPQVLASKKAHTFTWTSAAGHVYHLYVYPFEDIDGSPLVLELGIDVTARTQAEKTLWRRASQQAAVAILGQKAVEGADLTALMNEGVTAVAAHLDVEYAKILELLPSGTDLLLRAGVGWQEGLVGRATVDAGLDSQAGYTLASSQPVIVEDLRTETRFSGPPLLHAHGVVSGLSIVIAGRERPFGVLGAHAPRRQTFTLDDVHFVQAIANVLAGAIERKTVEDALRESEQNLQSLTFRLFNLQEAEKRRISRELHEDLGQTLQALSLQVSGIKGELPKKQEHLYTKCEYLVQHLKAVIDNLRRISQELSPAVLEELGLFAALRHLAENFCQHYRLDSWQVDLDAEVNLFSPKAQINIYRVLQEGLNNIGEHARATQVFLSGKHEDGRVSFILQDNGTGFDVEQTLARKAPGSGLGLAAMKERVKMLGGTLVIDSEPGKGTRISFSMPLDPGQKTREIHGSEECE
jgi:PAS domain S-box-containing protein